MKSSKKIQNIYKPFIDDRTITYIEIFDKDTKIHTPYTIYVINNDIIPEEQQNKVYRNGSIVKFRNFNVSVVIWHNNDTDESFIKTIHGKKLIYDYKGSLASDALDPDQEKEVKRTMEEKKLSFCMAINVVKNRYTSEYAKDWSKKKNRSQDCYDCLHRVPGCVH